MTIFERVAIIALSSVLAITGSAVASPADVAVSDLTASEVQECKNRVVLIKKEPERLETEWNGRTVQADYDGGLDEAYNNRLLIWNGKLENYSRWTDKKTGAKALDTQASEAAVANYIHKIEALEDSYQTYIVTSTNVQADKRVYCTSKFMYFKLNTAYQEIKSARVDLRKQRKSITAAGRKVTSALRAVKKQRDTLVRQRKIVRG